MMRTGGTTSWPPHPKINLLARMNVALVLCFDPPLLDTCATETGFYFGDRFVR